MTGTSIEAFCRSTDPLSSEAIGAILNHNEEDAYVDYKEMFNAEHDKHWLDLAVDVASYANTRGGYVVFGVADKTWSKVGLDDKDAEALANTNMVMQKVNRHVKPDLISLRTKKVDLYGKCFVVLHVPETQGSVHIMSKDGTYKLSSDKMKFSFKEGNIFIRNSASNQLVKDPPTLERVLKRYLEHYKAFLMDNIAKVVEADPKENVVIYKTVPTTGDGETYVATDGSGPGLGPGAVFTTIVPTTDEQQVATWIALAQKDKHFVPPEKTLWHLYANRHSTRCSAEQCADLVMFSVLAGLPTFFWMRKLAADQVKDAVRAALSRTSDVNAFEQALKTSAFIDKGFYNNVLGKVGERYSPVAKSISHGGPRELYSPMLVEDMRPRELARNEKACKSFFEDKLTEVATKLSASSDVIARRVALALDCYLYARDDRYASRPSPPE